MEKKVLPASIPFCEGKGKELKSNGFDGISGFLVSFKHQNNQAVPSGEVTPMGFFLRGKRKISFGESCGVWAEFGAIMAQEMGGARWDSSAGAGREEFL